jgi:hypothetical protein
MMFRLQSLCSSVKMFVFVSNDVQAAEPLLLGYSLDVAEDLKRSGGYLATLLEELPAPEV